MRDAAPFDPNIWRLKCQQCDTTAQRLFPENGADMHASEDQLRLGTRWLCSRCSGYLEEGHPCMIPAIVHTTAQMIEEEEES